PRTHPRQNASRRGTPLLSGMGAGQPPNLCNWWVMLIGNLFRLLSLQIIIASMFLPSCRTSDRMEGYLYYRLSTNPTTLDPAQIVDVTGGTISAKLFNGLVRLDKDMKVVPDIAERWTVSEDGLIYRFTLRKGVKFSNGREVKARDFKYSFERVLNKKTRSPNTWVLDRIYGAREFMDGIDRDLKGIRIINDYTIEIRLEKAFSPFIYLLTMTAAYVVPEEEVRRWGPDFSSHPVGTGPFILEEWLPNRELVLVRRDDYFEQKANINGIVYRIIPEDLTAVTEFELGNIDILSLPSSEYKRFSTDTFWKSQIRSLKGINTYYLGMNCSRHPFNNPALRKAINLAIDREKILHTYYEGRGRTARGPVPDNLRRWEAPEAYLYDSDMAREIIKKEGFAGLTINFYVTADQEVIDIAEIIQSYLRKVGLNVKIKQLEWSAFKEAINRGEPDMFWLSWWADYPDPENFLFPLFHSSNIGPAGNRTRYSNKEVDRLIEFAGRSRDEKTRWRYYERAERIIVQEAPWVFFWHKTDYVIIQPWINNFTVYPIYSMDKGMKIDVRNTIKEI
ncbi:MAG: ABC transporter substrate-binding protein, partial [Thermodesulfovibrionales bacterium]